MVPYRLLDRLSRLRRPRPSHTSLSGLWRLGSRHHRCHHRRNRRQWHWFALSAFACSFGPPFVGGLSKEVSQQILASPKIKLGYLTLTASCCAQPESRTLLSFGLFVDRARQAAGVLVTAPDISAKRDEMIAKEIQDMRDALQAFQTAIEAGEVAGFQSGAIRWHGST